MQDKLLDWSPSCNPSLLLPPARLVIPSVAGDRRQNRDRQLAASAPLNGCRQEEEQSWGDRSQEVNNNNDNEDNNRKDLALEELTHRYLPWSLSTLPVWLQLIWLCLVSTFFSQYFHDTVHYTVFFYTSATPDRWAIKYCMCLSSLSKNYHGWAWVERVPDLNPGLLRTAA
jgi:hypothetical protein